MKTEKSNLNLDKASLLNEEQMTKVKGGNNVAANLLNAAANSNQANTLAEQLSLAYSTDLETTNG